MESQELDPDRSARLSGARAEFIASLGRRLEAMRQVLAGLEQDPRSKSRKDNLMRRIHAMGAGARVLGFTAVAEALGTAEMVLQRSAAREVGAADLAEVARALEDLPSLVWGIASIAPPAAGAAPARDDRSTWPLSVLVYGGAALAEGLTDTVAGASPIEIERTEELDRARDLARTVGPDIVVLDADRRGARELAEAVLEDPLMEPAPLIVVGTFDTPDAAASLVALGAARVLPRPVSPDALRRSVLEISQLLAPRPGIREPLGEITVEALADRIAAEVRRGLIDAVEPLGRHAKIGLGEGTDVLGAVWGSVARVRELVTLRSGGAVRFEAAGPEGAIPLGSWSGERAAAERSAGDARDPGGVSLEGRTALVADDDPAVVWFIGGLLRAVGTRTIEAHDGRQALDLAYENWPDLVVSDLLMPGLDGFSLCREIKRDVAIRDVPVIVLSWKEDLLQRIRDLGADADGYLRKEASASTVVQRVREVLRPRARVEARLKTGGEVRGRLDGLTPRLVLQLTCAFRSDARVSIRDAAYLYEVQVREGRPFCATRTGADGGFERGEGVLGALLGASAGRFVVTPDHSSCRRDFEGPLEQVLKGPIARARAAQHALAAERFLRVERVEIDESAVLAYVASTPEPARSVVQKLLQGAAPRELVVTGDVSPRLLDLVLGDVARHGAILAVEGPDGEDLLARSSEALSVVYQPPTPLPGPQFTMLLSPGVPEVASPDPTPFASAQEPEAVLGEGWGQGEHTTLPGVGAAPVASPPPKVVKVPATDPFAETLNITREEIRSAPPPSRTRVNSRPSAPTLERDRGGVDLDHAVLEALEGSWGASDEEPRARTPTPPPGTPKALPALPRPESEDSAGVDAAASSLLARVAESPKPLRSGATLVLDAPPEEAEARALSEPPTEELPAAPVVPSAPPAPAESSPAVQAPVRSAPPPLPPEASVPPPKVVSEAPPAKSKPAPPAEPMLKPKVKVKPPAPAAGKAREGNGGGLLLMIALTAAAALASYGLMTWAMSTKTPPVSEPATASSVPAMPSAASALASAPAATKPSAPSAVVEDLALPVGVPVADGKGLLEVDTGGKQSIYVDTVFVGRGPTRRVPLDPGRHDVLLRLDAEELVQVVEVRAGRRTRLSLAAPP